MEARRRIAGWAVVGLLLLGSCALGAYFVYPRGLSGLLDPPRAATGTATPTPREAAPRPTAGEAGPPPLLAAAFSRSEAIPYPADWPAEYRLPEPLVLVGASAGPLPQGNALGWSAKLLYPGGVQGASQLLLAFFQASGWQVVDQAGRESGGWVHLLEKADLPAAGMIVIEPDPHDPDRSRVVVTLLHQDASAAEEQLEAATPPSTSRPPSPVPSPHPTATSYPDTGEPIGRIVYTCQLFRNEQTNQICLIHPDGSGFQRLTTADQFNHRYPSLSPDGRAVVFASNRAGAMAIFELVLSTGALRQITDLGNDYAPEISPDGKWVVFTHNDGSHRTIWLVGRDGRGLRQLTDPTAGDGWDPTWSPDGGQILFASDRAGPIQLFVMNRDGSGVQQVTDIQGLRGRSAWSPAGGEIATYLGSSWHWEIALLSADGSGLVTLTAGGNNLAPSYSPDGRWLAFTSYRDRYQDANGCEIYIMRTDGTEVTRLTDNNYCDWQPRWGP